ncbi:MAG: hypothetical protein M1837_005141 [Sclerophora amabilis]|nr:MAG: hypothetical protein M1837_005141 [Sclerophora amabilis]
MGNTVTTAETPSSPPPLDHPYYPIDAKIVGYLANTLSVPVLLCCFAGACVGIFGVTLLIIRGSGRKQLSKTDLATVLWFVLCGFLHLFFEGYFVLNHTSMGSRQDLFGQLWKEYSYSDSRYLTSDPFVLCMEAITAFLWGPLSFLAASLIASNHPLRHPLQALVSLGQLYGDVLYYATSMFDLYYKGLSYCRPESYYFWGYYFSLNFFWIVLPSILLYNSISQSARAFKALDKMSKTLQAQGNGSIKKSI